MTLIRILGCVLSGGKWAELSNFVVKRQHLLPLAKTPTKGSTISTALRRFFTRALQLLPFDNKIGANYKSSAIGSFCFFGFRKTIVDGTIKR